MEEQSVEKKVKRVKTEEELRLERLLDSRDKLRVIHLMRWNLLTIFPDVNNTSDYIEANEALTEIEKETWKYILEGLPD